MFNHQASNSSAANINSIAFIDQNLAQNNSLLQGLDADKVVVLGRQSHGFDQITQTLERYQNLESVHIFSHGSNNTLQLGNASFSQSDIDLYSDDLRRWGDALSSDADILIYGCNVAAGGDQFVQQIAQLTQADVAASDDLTGHASLGGDWDLEVSTGEIESGIAISLEAQAAYVGQLNETDDEPSDLPTQPLTFGGSRYELGTAGLTWQQAKAEAEARGGKIVEINSQAENDFILNNFGGENNPIWLGFNDVNTEGTFVDANGDPINYSNWFGAGPNNDNNQDYAAISTTTGQWDDINNIGGAFFENGVWVLDASNQLVIEFPESGSTPTPRPREGVNLIDNGSFEGINVLPRWLSFANDNQVSGWSSLNGDIEAWSNGYLGVASSDGNVFIELDIYGGQDGIYQDVRTEAGRTYLLSFDMRSRGRTSNSEDEAVYVQWNGQNLKGNGYRANAGREWETITVLVEGTGDLDRLQFSESTAFLASDGTGPFLDNISLKTIGAELTSSSILHGADGTFGAGIDTRYFQNIDADGNYVYGSTRLVDDNALSYELSDSDIDFLVTQAKLGVVSASDLADVSDARGIRELDGFGNNVRNPLWGNADQAYARIVNARYQNGVDQPRQGENPRDISNAILNQNRDGITDLFGPNAGNQDNDRPNNFRGSEFVPAFGQYFDHGLGFLPKGGVNGDGTAAGVQTDIGNSNFPLSLTRGSVKEGTGINGIAREHINQTSPFIDQNQAYGSNDAILEFLLERDSNGQFTGLLFAGPDGGMPNLGELKANWQKGVDAGLADAIDFNDPSTLRNFRGSGDPLIIDINRRIDIDDHLIAGDGRINENAGLTVVHEIWHNNHNYWVENLLTYFNDNGGVPSDLTTEHIFQMAKIINEGEYQRAVFDEFVELLVGSDVHAFRDYNPNINADLTHEFAAAAYRLGHSMLNNFITVRVDSADNVDFSKDDTVEVPLFDLFLNPTKFRELGAADIMAGMTTSLHQEIDSKIVTTLRNNLNGRPTDLASFNLARGRDVGLPTLNEMREAIGLSRYSDWSSFGSNLRDSSDLQKFQQAYNSVDDIDLWVGGLAEKVSSSNGFNSELAINSVMGETFAQVFSAQMIGLQDGDRFYYKHRLFETNLRQNMQSQDFADIVERTLGLEYLQADILKTIDNRLDFRDVDQTQLTLDGTSGHDVIIARNIGETINGQEGDDTIHAKAGKDIVYGEDGDDALHGGAGDDELIGGSGDDRADGGTGNDTILGGDGDDDISGNDGNDYMDGEANDDELFGGKGQDTLLGSDGNDNIWGGLGNDTVEGGADNDNLSGNEGNDFVDGGSGQDVIIGGAGNDTLIGGSGADEFWFLPGSGDDVIKDFDVSQDRIDLHRSVWEYGANRVNSSQLQENARDTAAGVLLFLPSNSNDRANSILIEGVSRSELFSNTSNLLIFQDRVFERENLVLSRDNNIVLGAGSDRAKASDFTVKVEDLQRSGFTLAETFETEKVASLKYSSTIEGAVITEDFADKGETWTDRVSGEFGLWSNPKTGSYDGNIYLGDFGSTRTTDADTELTYSVDADANAVTFNFDFLEIDSWDDENFFIYINEQQIDLGRFKIDSYLGPDRTSGSGTSGDVSWSYESQGSASTNFVGTAWTDERHAVSVTVNNVTEGEDITLGFGSSLNQDSSNESWGVENLEVIGAQVDTVVRVSGEFGLWSNPKTGSYDGNIYLGDFGSTRTTDADTELTYSVDADANAVTFNFDFLEIDSWDDENFFIYINEQQIDLGRFKIDSYLGPDRTSGSGTSGDVSWSYESQGSASTNFVGTAWTDERHAVSVTVNNVTEGEDITLGFGSSLNQDSSNESWGVENLEVIGAQVDTVVPEAEAYLGGYGKTDVDGAEIEKTFSLNPGLESVTVEFDFMEIDSWDFERFYAYVNGQEIDLGRFYVFRESDDASGQVGNVSWERTSLTGLTQIPGTGSYQDEVHRVTMTIENPGPSLQLGFGSNLLESASNQSWRVDNLRITENNPLVLNSSADGQSGTLSYTYDGDWGLFDLDVFTFDENDGVSQLEILVNGDVVHTHTLDQDLGTDEYNSNSQVTVTAEMLLLNKGDLIQVRGIGNGGEFIRISKLDFRALEDQTRSVFL